MTSPPRTNPAVEGQRSVRYVLPFVLFLVVLASSAQLPVSAAVLGPLWFVVFVPTIALCWPKEITIRPAHALVSIAIGLAVFIVWIAPDLLIPGYRHSILFSNSLLGSPHSSMTDSALRNPWVLAWRTARAALIVPVVEELFWRAWLMRWIINPHFERVPLGAYSIAAFWITALLFASEHGSYWDVGLLTGIVYNLWMIRSKSVADCILTHAVTNAALSAYVIASGHWQYWQ